MAIFRVTAFLKLRPAHQWSVFFLKFQKQLSHLGIDACADAYKYDD
jgi:hypothetical protein